MSLAPGAKFGGQRSDCRGEWREGRRAKTLAPHASRFLRGLARPSRRRRWNVPRTGARLPGTSATIFSALQKWRKRSPHRRRRYHPGNRSPHRFPSHPARADRRSRGPYGLSGGASGAPGRTLILREDGSPEELPSKTSTRLHSGERVRVEAPGRGGWGKAN
jgi:hypothetical protein